MEQGSSVSKLLTGTIPLLLSRSTKVSVLSKFVQVCIFFIKMDVISPVLELVMTKD